MSDTQPESARMLGEVLGHYRLEGELGTGGMGSVYRARHEVLGRTVAVKLLRTELTTRNEHVTRFINEARAASAIRHPGIVEVLDFGYTDDGRAYLVMELLDGVSLAQRIASRGRLSEAEASHIARGIASALTAAHGRGIIHRDLKPDNIFLAADPDLVERPKLLDFGIAKLGDLAHNTSYTQTGALMGTPLYMAPEQARTASEIDHRADLYSLGCMLYEMLVGEPPFVAIGAGEIIALQLFGNVTPPSTRVPGLSSGMNAIVLRLLEKEPSARFLDAAELTDALDRLAHGLPAPAPGAGAKKRSFAPAGELAIPTIDERPPRKSRLPIVAVAIALAVTVVLVTVVLVARSSEPTRSAEPAGSAAAPPTVMPPAAASAPRPPVQPPDVTPPTPPPAKPVKPDRPARPAVKRYTAKHSPIENEL